MPLAEVERKAADIENAQEKMAATSATLAAIAEVDRLATRLGVVVREDCLWDRLKCRVAFSCFFHLQGIEGRSTLSIRSDAYSVLELDARDSECTPEAEGVGA